MTGLTPPARRAVAAMLAGQQNISEDEALARVVEVERDVKAGPHARAVLVAALSVARPILNEIEVAMRSPDPTSPEAVLPVVAAIAAVMPEGEEST